MSEKVLMQKKTRERLLTAGDGCAFISGLLLSALPIETSWWLLLLLMALGGGVFSVCKSRKL